MVLSRVDYLPITQVDNIMFIKMIELGTPIDALDN